MLACVTAASPRKKNRREKTMRRRIYPNLQTNEWKIRTIN